MHQQDVRGSKGAQRQQQQLGALVGARPRASCRPLKSRGAKTGRFSTAVWAASVSWRARAHAHVPACRLSPNSASPATARKARARKASTTTAAAVVHAQSRACPAGASAGLPRGQRSSRGAPTASAKPRWHAPPAQCHTHGEGYPSCSSGHVATSGSGGAARAPARAPCASSVMAQPQEQPWASPHTARPRARRGRAPQSGSHASRGKRLRLLAAAHKRSRRLQRRNSTAAAASPPRAPPRASRRAEGFTQAARAAVGPGRVAGSRAFWPSGTRSKVLHHQKLPDASAAGRVGALFGCLARASPPAPVRLPEPSGVTRCPLCSPLLPWLGVTRNAKGPPHCTCNRCKLQRCESFWIVHQPVPRAVLHPCRC